MRRLRTFIVLVLTVFWTSIYVPVAGGQHDAGGHVSRGTTMQIGTHGQMERLGLTLMRQHPRSTASMNGGPREAEANLGTSTVTHHHVPRMRRDLTKSLASDEAGSPPHDPYSAAKSIGGEAPRESTGHAGMESWKIKRWICLGAAAFVLSVCAAFHQARAKEKADETENVGPAQHVDTMEQEYVGPAQHVDTMKSAPRSRSGTQAEVMQAHRKGLPSSKASSCCCIFWRSAPTKALVPSPRRLEADNSWKQFSEAWTLKEGAAFFLRCKLEAHCIPDVGEGSTCLPWVEVRIVDHDTCNDESNGAGKKGCLARGVTKQLHGDLNPNWPEAVTLDAAYTEQCSVHFVLWDAGRALGFATLPLDTALASPRKSDEHTLKLCPIDGSQGLVTSATTLSVTLEHGAVCNLLLTVDRASKLPKVTACKPTDVVVEAAILKISSESGGESVITQARTSRKACSLNPRWWTLLKMPYPEIPGLSIRLTVLNVGAAGEMPLGQVLFPLEEALVGVAQNPPTPRPWEFQLAEVEGRVEAKDLENSKIYVKIGWEYSKLNHTEPKVWQSSGWSESIGWANSLSWDSSSVQR